MTIAVYTTSLCADCARVKHILNRLQISFVEHNIHLDEDAYDDLLRLSPGPPRVPTLVMPDGSVLIEPDNLTLYASIVANGEDVPVE